MTDSSPEYSGSNEEYTLPFALIPHTGIIFLRICNKAHDYRLGIQGLQQRAITKQNRSQTNLKLFHSCTIVATMGYTAVQRVPCYCHSFCGWSPPAWTPPKCHKELYCTYPQMRRGSCTNQTLSRLNWIVLLSADFNTKRNVCCKHVTSAAQYYAVRLHQRPEKACRK